MQNLPVYEVTPLRSLWARSDDLIAPQHRLQEALAISRGVSQGEVLRADTVRLRKDGRPVFVELMVFPVRIGDEHIGDYVSYRDMTERKRAEDELRQSEEKFRAAFEGSHDAITITTKEGNVLDCNRRALEVLGLASKEDFRDRRPSDFSPPFQPDGRASRAAAREKVHRVLERGVLSRFDWLHQRPNGETFPAEILLTSLRRDLVLREGTAQEPGGADLRLDEEDCRRRSDDDRDQGEP